MEPVKIEGIDASIYVEKIYNEDEIIQTYYVEIDNEIKELNVTLSVPSQKILELLGLEKELNSSIAEEIKYSLQEMEKNNDNNS